VTSELWDLIDPKPGYCCQDAYASDAKGGPQLHTSGCPRRCGWMVRVPRAAERDMVAGYPCGLTVDHLGDCWLHPMYRLAADGVPR